MYYVRVILQERQPPPSPAPAPRTEVKARETRATTGKKVPAAQSAAAKGGARKKSGKVRGPMQPVVC